MIEFNKVKYPLAILWLMIIGAAIRLHAIGFQSANWDEMFTLSFAAPDLSVYALIIKALSVDYTPPLFYLAAHLSMLIFGATVEAIRYPSAICGVLMIPAMYFVGKEFRNRNVGIIAATATTFCYTLIFYSQYGRSYSMALLFFALTFYHFIRLLKGDRHSGVLFALFSVLTLWSHLYFAIPIGLMILYALVEKRAVVETFIIGILTLPLVNYVFLILNTRVTGDGTNNFGMSQFEILFITPIDIIGYSVFLVVPIVLWVLYKKRKEIEIQFMWILYVISIMIMLYLSSKTPMIVHYVIYMLPLFLLLVSTYFYDLYKKQTLNFYHFLIIMVIVILELVQIVALATIARF